MKMKTTVGICLLTMLVITSGSATVAAQTTETQDTEVQFVLGLFPSVQDGHISFLSLSPPGQGNIPEEDFRGHVGVVLIIGFYNPAPM